MAPEEYGGLKRKLKAVIVFRAVFVTLFFGASLFFRVFESVVSIYYLISFIYILTLIYSVIFSRIRNVAAFAYVQLVLDVFIEITLIGMTGGIASLFAFTLVVTTIASSILLGKKGGFAIATLSSLLYGMLLNLQLFRILPFDDVVFTQKEYFYKLFIHVIFFYLTAYLSGYLSSRLERTIRKLEEKDLDLRELELFNREVLEEMPSGIFTVDMNGHVLLFNKSAERITGVLRDAVIGKRIDAVLPCFSFPFREGRGEMTMTAEGIQKIVGLTVTPFKGMADSTKGYIAVFQDLTQIKKLEDEVLQKEKWATIGELSSNIAHEIRNPLASLKGSIQMLKEDSVSANYKERLMEIALNEMDRLNRIVTDFLTYSRPSLPEIVECDLHSLIDETAELLKNLLPHSSPVKILTNYTTAGKIKADPQKLRQVLWNLGVNALEAMPDGGNLRISTQNSDGYVKILFQDSGTGIEEKNLSNIFFPFFTTKEEGTGLGLAIAYRIVEEHKGSLRVKSSSSHGTTFEIAVPGGV
jgi:two-component system, NtrC family, sensor histidine kinase PilS